MFNSSTRGQRPADKRRTQMTNLAFAIYLEARFAFDDRYLPGPKVSRKVYFSLMGDDLKVDFAGEMDGTVEMANKVAA